MRNYFLTGVLSFGLLVSAQDARAQTLSKGHQILLQRGVQSLALGTRDDVFNINTVKAANFTGVVWIWGLYNNGLLGTAPGVPWGRWVDDPNRDGMGNMSDMPPVASPTDEGPYMSNLIQLSLGDEQDLNNAAYRVNQANWFNAVRSSYPNTLLYVNSWGYQWQDGNYLDYINTSNPDMLSMDTYDFVVGNAKTPGGSPGNLYHSMRQVRAFGTDYAKPYQLYTQTYHAGVEGDGFARRDPSDSELRLNYFAGVSFGFTSFVCFTYNTGASSLFTSPGGDSNPTALYSTVTDINAKLKKLSPVLTRLKPRKNIITGYDASMLYYRGQHNSGGTTVDNPAPDGDFLIYTNTSGDPNLGNYSNYFAHNNQDWVSAANPGTFRGISNVTNLGNRNLDAGANPLRGDVWMMWFTVLDEAFDGPEYSDQVYIMILNGLSDPTGNGADCRQSVRINYVDNSLTQQLLVFNQQTGNVDTIVPPIISGRRQPTFTLDGGECVIYKFNTGAPFVGIPSASAKAWSLYD